MSSSSKYSHHHFKWGKFKIFLTGGFFIFSCIYIYSQISPFFDGTHEAKDIGGAFFSAFHLYMMISAFKIHTNSSYIFFILTYIMLVSITICFIFYESLFIGDEDDEEEEEEGGGDEEEEE